MSNAHQIAEVLRVEVQMVATSLLGPPAQVTHAELRWGRRGSLSIVIKGHKRGLWFDHERGIGGDMLDLICDQREKIDPKPYRLPKQIFSNITRAIRT